VREGDCLRTAVDAELSEDALDVRRDSLFADHEDLRDLFLIEALCEEPEDLPLPFRQLPRRELALGERLGRREILADKRRGRPAWRDSRRRRS
jgi:hypothetical protein